MFRTVGDQPSLFESVLPEELLRLPEELGRVDAMLDDPAFFAPFVPFFDPRIGRPSTPMETYLRLMFLKFRYRLGYESLCREVSDSITWRRFCRIPLEGSVPHPTTLMKLTTRCGPAAVEGLNEALLAKAAAGEAAAHQPGPGGHHGGARPTSPTRPTRVCWPRRSAGSRPRSGGSRPPVVRPAPRCGTGPGRLGKRAHAIGAKLRMRSAAGQGRGAGRGAPGHRRAGRPGRDRRQGRRAGAGQRQAGAAAGPREGQGPSGQR